ncbi:pyruvate formate lyase activating enzyme [Enterococcus sp. AZ194]
MKTPYIFNIQKFSVHDGPGIRTTIFFKGCPIRCLWCHNPESQKYTQEVMLNKDGVEEVVGQQYTIDKIVKKVQSDQIFYDQSGGGVTFSGGEVMTHSSEYIVELARRIKRLGISIMVDTCGVAPQENYEKILPYVDGFLYDLKFIDSQLHERYTLRDNVQVKENLKFISDKGGKIYLRLILLKGINDQLETIEETVSWLKENKLIVSEINLLPYHDFGKDKYDRLGRECTQNFEKPDDAQLHIVEEYLEKEGYNVKIGG